MSTLTRSQLELLIAVGAERLRLVGYDPDLFVGPAVRQLDDALTASVQLDGVLSALDDVAGQLRAACGAGVGVTPESLVETLDRRVLGALAAAYPWASPERAAAEAAAVQFVPTRVGEYVERAVVAAELDDVIALVQQAGDLVNTELTTSLPTDLAVLATLIGARDRLYALAGRDPSDVPASRQYTVDQVDKIQRLAQAELDDAFAAAFDAWFAEAQREVLADLFADVETPEPAPAACDCAICAMEEAERAAHPLLTLTDEQYQDVVERHQVDASAGVEPADLPEDGGSVPTGEPTAAEAALATGIHAAVMALVQLPEMTPEIEQTLGDVLEVLGQAAARHRVPDFAVTLPGVPSDL